jgi:lipid-A-disaccharide synthase
MTTRRLLVVAGEVSGDIHAGNMLGELRKIVPDLFAFGIGGERLQDNGLELLATTDELAHMGLVEVFRELPRIRRLMQRLVDEAKRQRPDLAVLVDSPDFNLRLARKLGVLGIPVVLYVSPQLWAWRQGRVREVRRVAEEVLCILPFEIPFYQEHGVRARYVGHPLVDEIDRVGLFDRQMRTRKDRLALLPGSRAMEVGQLLPVMLRTLAELEPDRIREAVLIEAPGMEGEVDRVLEGVPIDARLLRVRGEERRQALAESAIAWTASGTATLECALLGVPMVVGYRLKALSFALARLLVRVPNVALVNLIAGETVVPELLQNDWNPERLESETAKLLAGGGTAQRGGLARVRESLGAPGASYQAAQAISEYFGG